MASAVFETLVGVGLLLGRGLRLVLALFVLQMMGTFLVLVAQPDIAFQDGNPLMLTTEGEFVVKNLVLLSAGLMIGSRLRALSSWTREDEGPPREDVAKNVESGERLLRSYPRTDANYSASSRVRAGLPTHMIRPHDACSMASA
jgi:hypothetical protein